MANWKIEIHFQSTVRLIFPFVIVQGIQSWSGRELSPSIYIGNQYNSSFRLHLVTYHAAPEKIVRMQCRQIDGNTVSKVNV